MAIGDLAAPQARSYVAVGRETTLGTYASATTAMEFLSCTFQKTIESTKIAAIGPTRAYGRRVQLGHVTAGSLEHNLHPIDSTLMIINALGGGVVTTSQSGIAIHSITAGNFDTLAASLSFNVRKGDVITYRYVGGRVNQLTISAAVGEVAKASYEMVFIDGTQQSDDILSTLSISSVLPFVYTQGVFRYGNTEANAATTTSEERIQGFELVLNNNIISDTNARELGRTTPRVLPATKQDVTFSITQRADTTTTWARFTSATAGAIELLFDGVAITSTSALTYRMLIRLPNVTVNSPDPTLDSATDVVKSDITFDVLSDNINTTTGRAIGATVQNVINAY